MRLDEQGWGLSSIFAFCCVFLIALILIGISAYKIGLADSPISNLPTQDYPSPSSNNSSGSITVPTPTGGETYTSLENRLREAGKFYKEVYYNQMIVGDSTYVTTERLEGSNYLQPLVTEKLTLCTGYVQIYNHDGTFEYHPFIKCAGEYQTPGYLERFDQ